MQGIEQKERERETDRSGKKWKEGLSFSQRREQVRNVEIEGGGGQGDTLQKKIRKHEGSIQYVERGERKG